MSLLYNVPHINLKAYDTRSLINRRGMLMDFNRLSNKYHAQMVLEFNEKLRRFELTEEASNVRLVNPRPYLVLCDHSLHESRIAPVGRDRIELHILRRCRRFGGRWTLPRPHGVSADMHSITCINVSNARNNLYSIADVQKELSPGYMFLATEPKPTDMWCPSDLDLIDHGEDAIEDTVSISFYRNSNQ